MSKTDFYRQCVLRRYRGNGYVELTSYIPIELCELGAVLKLLDDEGEWTDDWQIKQMGQCVSAAQIEANERTWARPRKASDL